jgi:hypothetical protein
MMLELSHEDTLRLNVLVMNVEAIRIDERTLTVYGLSGRGEARVQLNPTGRPESYLKAVREFLSTAALGSPGGYPVHLNRWTRMGQARDANLAKLLMLGEPEAIAAVVCAPGLTDELARRAWWTDTTADNARRMLARSCVVEGGMGRVLAGFLVEHLPFETEARLVIETVRLVLQPGLIDDGTRRKLWDKGASNGNYRIGFLLAQPDELPQVVPARADLAVMAPALTALARQDDALAGLLQRALSGSGQAFLATCDALFQKLSDQDAAVALLNAVSRYFGAARLTAEPCQDVATILADAKRAATETQARAVVAVLPHLEPELRALHVLARTDEAVVTPIFARSSATGSLMRRKIEPVIRPVLDQIAVLRRPGHG